MRIGFYAPLKSPEHPVPSGDRAMARALMSVLRELGHDVELICQLRSFDRHGDLARQNRLKELGDRAADALLRCQRRHEHPFDLLFTYHLYHKAPDWIAPKLARALGIPHVIAEASIAGKQAHGPWALGHEAVIDAVMRAGHVLALTELDAEALAGYVTLPERLSLLRPFVDMPEMVGRKFVNDRAHLLTVAMMRQDVKRQSYELLAKSLKGLRDLDWQLDIIGDGPAMPAIRAAFADLGNRIRFHGAVRPEDLSQHYEQADIFVWPGLNEAFGLVFLEAQAHGLPIVSIGEGGVSEIVKNGQTGLLSQSLDPQLFARHVRLLIEAPDQRRQLGLQAIDHVRKHHSTDVAKETLRHVLARIEA